MVVKAFIEGGATSVALIDLHQEAIDQAKLELLEWFGMTTLGVD